MFDFNGTLSDDEPLLASIFADALGRYGVRLSRERYYAELAGLSDAEIATRGLELHGGRAQPGAVAEILALRGELYRHRVAVASPLRPGAAGLVRALAARVPVGVVSGAQRADVEAVLGAAGLLELLTVTICAEDVRAGKPDPEGYLRALAALAPPRADAVVAIEDSIPGIVAAKRPGMRCPAVRGTSPDKALAARADRVLDDLHPALVADLLGDCRPAPASELPDDPDRVGYPESPRG
ncbi:MAG: HAD family hydrolase [Solirubrobacteraceae bacterium]